MSINHQPSTINRLQKLRARLREKELPAALIRQPQNVGYLTGFTGSTAQLLVTEGEAHFITDSRYAAQARTECAGLTVVLTETGGTYEDRIKTEVEALGIQRLAVEGDVLTVHQFNQ